ncbi:MAG TPA: hypothetical protein VHD83_26740, partial [Puia sp.]|nr:hypothetical protein [Puia sp.]
MTRSYAPVLYCLLLLSSGSLLANKPYWQQEVRYDIRVTLDDAAHTLKGFETMVYSNNSPDTLHYIYIHCWPNA